MNGLTAAGSMASTMLCILTPWRALDTARTLDEREPAKPANPTGQPSGGTRYGAVALNRILAGLAKATPGTVQ